MDKFKDVVASVLAPVIAVSVVVLIAALLFVSTVLWCLVRPFIAVSLFLIGALHPDCDAVDRAVTRVKQLDKSFGMWG